MKKLIYLLIAISLLATFSACGKEEAQNSSEQSTGTKTENATNEESLYSEETDEESESVEETDEESLYSEETSKESAVAEEKLVFGKQTLYDAEEALYVSITNTHGESKLNRSVYEQFNTKKATYIKSFYDFVCHPFAIGTVENPKELSYYGLDGEGQATVKASAVNKEYYLRIGNSVEGAYYFALLGEKSDSNSEITYGDTVYILGDIVSCAFEEPLYFATEYYGQGNMRVHFYYTEIDWFKLTTEDESYKFYPISDSEKGEFGVNSKWKLTAPERLFRDGKSYENVNDANVCQMLYSICNLRCDNILVTEPTDEDIARYGLDKPYRSYSYRTMGDTYTVYMTKPDEEGKYYVYAKEDYREGCCYGTNVFSIGVMEKPFEFMEYTDYSLVIDTLFLKPLSEVTAMEISTVDGVHTININRMTDSGYSIITLDGETPDLLPYNLDSCYNVLRSIEIEYQYGEIPPEACDMKIVLNCGDEMLVYRFYVLNSESVHCKVNGDEDYLISRSAYDRFVESYKLLLANERIPE